MNMEYRLVFAMVFTLGLVGFSKATVCGDTCQSCYPNDAFTRMSCVSDCTGNEDTFSCGSRKRSSSSLQSEVETFNSNWATLMKAENIEGIKNTYVADCTYVIVTSSVLQGFGKTDMGQAYTNWFEGNSNIDRVEFTVVKAEEGSGLVFGYGKMNGFDSNNSPVFSYNYIKFFKRSGGNLQGYIDIVWS